MDGRNATRVGQPDAGRPRLDHQGALHGGMAGATAMKAAMQTGDMSDDATPQMTQAAIDLAPIASGSAIRPVTQLPSQVAPSAADAAVAAAERIGVTIPKYMATDGPVAPALAQGAKAVPFAGKPVITAANKTRSGLQNAIDTAAPSTAPDVAGQAAKDAITQNIKVDAPAAVSALYQKLEGGPNGGEASPIRPCKCRSPTPCRKCNSFKARELMRTCPSGRPT